MKAKKVGKVFLIILAVIVALAVDTVIDIHMVQVYLEQFIGSQFLFPAEFIVPAIFCLQIRVHQLC